MWVYVIVWLASRVFHAVLSLRFADVTKEHKFLGRRSTKEIKEKDGCVIHTLHLIYLNIQTNLYTTGVLQTLAIKSLLGR